MEAAHPMICFAGCSVCPDECVGSSEEMRDGERSSRRAPMCVYVPRELLPLQIFPCIDSQSLNSN